MIFYSILKCLATVQEEDRQKKTKKKPTNGSFKTVFTEIRF